MTTPTTAAEWNQRYPIGTRVNAYPGSRDGRVLATMTRSTAWTLPGGQAVVLVEGHAGGIALTHVDPADEPMLWSIASHMTATLPNGRRIYQATGAAVSVRWWPDGRVEPGDTTMHAMDGDTVRLVDQDSGPTDG